MMGWRCGRNCQIDMEQMYSVLILFSCLFWLIPLPFMEVPIIIINQFNNKNNKFNLLIVGKGADNTVTDNVVIDTVNYGGGIQIGTRFNSSPLFGTTYVQRNTLIRTGQSLPLSLFTLSFSFLSLSPFSLLFLSSFSFFLSLLSILFLSFLCLSYIICRINGIGSREFLRGLVDLLRLSRHFLFTLFRHFDY